MTNVTTMTPRPKTPEQVYQEEYAAAYAEAAKLENDRIMGILELPEAQGRRAQARVLAENPNITPDQARKIFQTIPAPVAEAPAAGAGDFDDWMAETGGGAGVLSAESPDLATVADGPAPLHADAVYTRLNEARANRRQATTSTTNKI